MPDSAKSLARKRLLPLQSIEYPTHGVYVGPDLFRTPFTEIGSAAFWTTS